MTVRIFVKMSTNLVKDSNDFISVVLTVCVVTRTTTSSLPTLLRLRFFVVTQNSIVYGELFLFEM